MSPQPQLGDLDLWGEHERLCLQLLREALAELVDCSTEDIETGLNRFLYRAIIRASHRAAKRCESPPVVVPEGHNPPVASDQERAEREFKIPDFYWAYIEPYASDPTDSAKQFVVECKRLTEPRSHYTREYVKSGIMRFIHEGHGYAKGVASGAMVGYMQRVVLEDALARINGVADREFIQPLALKMRDGEATAEFDQDLVRPFPESPFHLTHIWTRMGTQTGS